jgi:cytochrome b561
VTRRTDPRYTAPAMALHWLIALIVVGTFGVGLWMTGLPSGPQKSRVYEWHKWAGATFLALTLLRMAWRATHAAPAPLPSPPWQQRLATTVHALLYVMFLVVPLLGWAYSSALGYGLVWFGVLPLPDLLPKDRALADAVKPWHGRAAWLLAVLVALHLAGVVKHQWLDRQPLLQRMWPPWRR